MSISVAESYRSCHKINSLELYLDIDAYIQISRGFTSTRNEIVFVWLIPNLGDPPTDSSQSGSRFWTKQRPMSGWLKCHGRELKHRRCLLKMTHKQVGRWRRHRVARAAPRDPPGLNLSPGRNLKQHLRQFSYFCEKGNQGNAALPLTPIRTHAAPCWLCAGVNSFSYMPTHSSLYDGTSGWCCVWGSPSYKTVDWRFFFFFFLQTKPFCSLVLTN